ncbi:hypothetical protein EIP91_003294 [Steccherinum ochraceum]|uniref:Uncharacterized protein n=1 Tax=Steccherinum ochraceum TaxID=92696 RepID=A0A4R0RDC3_9APHY|nr:hypothetical protein EIP91_003294 [Steccherinum ochraceum]
MAVESANAPAMPVQGGLDVPTTKTRKRALTVTAPTPSDPKKTKVDPPPMPTPDIHDAPITPSHPAETPKPTLEQPPTAKLTEATTTDGPVKDKKEPWWKSCRTEKTFRLPGPGPHTFLTGSECLSCLFDGEGGNFLVLKSEMLQVLAKAKAHKDDEDFEESELMNDVVFRDISHEEVEEEPEEYFALSAMFGETESGDGVTYEVTVQREQPEKGLPALKFEWTMEFEWEHIAEEDQGTWWITAISAPDKESLEAGKILWDNLPQRYS